jgi:acyl-CoA synthetase (AMP-forming)/AMP-acid ligase II
MRSFQPASARIEAMPQVFWIGDSDRIVGVLPFFHSFGFTVTIWFPLISGCGVVYHANPTEAKFVGGLIEKYHGTCVRQPAIGINMQVHEKTLRRRLHIFVQQT